MAQLSHAALDDRIARLDALTGEEFRPSLDELGDAATALQRARAAIVEPYLWLLGPV
jgi:hypothetical protein